MGLGQGLRGWGHHFTHVQIYDFVPLFLNFFHQVVVLSALARDLALVTTACEVSICASSEVLRMRIIVQVQVRIQKVRVQTAAVFVSHSLANSRGAEAIGLEM